VCVHGSETGDSSETYTVAAYGPGPLDKYWRSHLNDEPITAAEFNAALQYALALPVGVERPPADAKHLYRTQGGDIYHLRADGGQVMVTYSQMLYHSSVSIQTWSPGYPGLYRPIEVGRYAGPYAATKPEFSAALKLAQRMVRAPFASAQRPPETAGDFALIEAEGWRDREEQAWLHRHGDLIAPCRKRRAREEQAWLNRVPSTAPSSERLFVSLTPDDAGIIASRIPDIIEKGVPEAEAPVFERLLAALKKGRANDHKLAKD
jgi:hypothetical protein